MIKGKLEAPREICPGITIVGDSKFTFKGGKWIVYKDPKAEVFVEDLLEAYEEPETSRNSKLLE